jgi:hypothetical protein
MVLVLALRNSCYKSSLASVIVQVCTKVSNGWGGFLGNSTVVVSRMLVQQEQSTFKNSMVLKLQSLVLPATARYLL